MAEKQAADRIRALALDLATTTGYATFIDGLFGGGSFKVSRKKGRKLIADEHEGKEYADFQRWLESLIARVRPQIIFYELPSMFKNPVTGYKPLAFRGFLMAESARGVISTRGYNLSTVKKFATGNGHAKKPAMIAAAAQRFPQLEIVDDNMADALHVLRYGLKDKFGVIVPRPKRLQLS